MKLKNILNEETPPAKIKSQQLEDFRMIAQTLAAAEERLREILASADSESSVAAFADATLKHVTNARKTFKGITKG